MLDDPEAPQYAQRLVDEFVELNEAHQTVVTAREQIHVLQPARYKFHAYEQAGRTFDEFEEVAAGIDAYVQHIRSRLLLREHAEVHTDVERLRQQLREAALQALELLRARCLDKSGSETERSKPQRRRKREPAQAACDALDWAFPGSGDVVWQEWPRLGRQCMPARMEFANALDVATFVGEQCRWQRASTLAQRWAVLAESERGRHFDMLADYTGEDFETLQRLLQWLQAHPRSGLYLRQLPVPGFHTKWVEKRKAQACIRMRVLCPRLRACIGGLGGVESPVDELAALAVQPQCVLVVENLETGLALPDMPRTVVFMKLGHAVGLLVQLPWLQGYRAVY